MGFADSGIEDPGSIRPELPIPLAPVSTPQRLFRRVALGLAQPSFRQARNITLLLLTTACVLALAGGVGLEGRPAAIAVAAAAGLAVYTCVRAVALVLLERRQHTFETAWLTALSHALQRHRFELLRFSLGNQPEGRQPAIVSFDLTDPADVRQVLDRQTDSRRTGTSARMRIEFSYRPDDTGGPAVENARRALTDIEFHPIDAPIVRAHVRFPRARYLARPETSGTRQRWPARTAHWSLTGPVRLTTARPSPVGSRPGSSSGATRLFS